MSVNSKKEIIKDFIFLGYGVWVAPPKIYINSPFSENFLTRKLGGKLVFYAVYLIKLFCCYRENFLIEIMFQSTLFASKLVNLK